MTNSTVEAQNIFKSYGSTEVLKGVSLDAEKGDVISIIGSSGSGKSTFLRCINFLETPNSGRIRVGDDEIVIASQTSNKPAKLDQKKIERMRMQLGMVFQGFNLWSHMTVLQNIMEGPVHVQNRSKSEVRDEAMHYLGKVGIADKHASYPSQ